MGQWIILPAEIRSIILETVAEDYRFKSEPYARAGYASVCREWQLVFEQRNFQRVILNQDRIATFEQFFGRTPKKHRQEYLKQIFLRVRLDEYDCTVCQTKEDEDTIRRNNDIFSRAIWSLLTILSQWRRCTSKNLTLELGVYSPSDSKHTFRDFHLEDNYPYQERGDLEPFFEAYRLRAEKLGQDSLNDLHHGWVDGRQDSVSLDAKSRIMGTLTLNPNNPGCPVLSKKLPKVEIVTELLIRRQFYRKIAVSSLRKLLGDAFKNLRWFRHEGWHDVDLQQQSRFETGYKSLLSRSLPGTLRKLYIFEDYNKCLNPERSSEHANRSLGRTLSKNTRSLEMLSAAFLIDAKDFLADFWPTKVLPASEAQWANLRTLALTSRLLHPETGGRKITRLLVAAGRAAAFMPKLELMEIWNGGDGHACVFQYSSGAGKPQITWKSNWGGPVQLPLDLVHCWAGLPDSEQPRCESLKTAVTRLRRRRKLVKSHSTAIRYLCLRSVVVHPISDYQLSWEELETSKG